VKAVFQARRLTAKAGQRARAFTELASAYYARAQYKVALDELRKAITADNRYGPAYNIYGLIYMELAEDKLAEKISVVPSIWIAAIPRHATTTAGSSARAPL